MQDRNYKYSQTEKTSRKLIFFKTTLIVLENSIAKMAKSLRIKNENFPMKI